MFLIAIFYVLERISQEKNDCTLCVLRWETGQIDSHLRLCLSGERGCWCGRHRAKKQKMTSPFSYSFSKLVLKLKDGEWVVIHPPEVSGVSDSGSEVEFPIKYLSLVR